jgi:acetolactate synthase-1/2/3 large subunit
MSSQHNNPAKNGAEIVVQTLEAHNVEYIFGIPGAKIDSVFNALVDSKIKTVVCRHEQNAAFIAGGIGRMTGKAGVALVTSGPGVSNLVTGLATANSEGDPVVALGGAVATSQALKQVHQTMDSVSICKPVTKFSAVVGACPAVSEVIANAFRAAESGRPGAAFVSLPQDIMMAAAEGGIITPKSFAGPGPADATAIAEAARLINAAENPVVLLGLSASTPANAKAVRDFISRNNLPVVGTFQAAGAVAANLMSNFGGRVGLMENQPADSLLEAADLVITVGYDPVEYEPLLWNKAADRKIIHIDVLMADLDAYYSPSVELTGDVAQNLYALTPQIERSKKSALTESILQTIAAERTQLNKQAAQAHGTPIHPLRIVFELQQMLSSDVTVCLDMGSVHIWLARHLYSFKARQILISNGQQTLGVAMPWAIAATLVRPGEKVLSISGDGGFLFTSMELETAVRLKCNFVHMIWIDGTYDMVAIQEVKKYGRKSGIDFGPVDYVKYAEAFGATGLMIRTADDIAPVLKKAFDTPGPVLVGVHVDYSYNPKLYEVVHENELI